MAVTVVGIITAVITAQADSEAVPVFTAVQEEEAMGEVQDHQDMDTEPDIMVPDTDILLHHHRDLDIIGVPVEVAVSHQLLHIS